MKPDLRHLIAGGIFVLALGGQLVFAVFELRNARAQTEHSLLLHARVIGNVLSSAVESAERRGRLEEAYKIFAQTRIDRRLVDAAIVDDRDRILLSTTLVLRGKGLQESPLADATELLRMARAHGQGQVALAADGNSVLSAFPVRLEARPDELVGGRIAGLLMRHNLVFEKSVALRRVVIDMLQVGAGTLMLSLLVWLYFDRILVRPLRLLARASDELAHGVHEPVTPRLDSTLEIRQLGQAFDGMAERLQRRTELLQESHAFLDATMDAVPSHLAVLDEQGTIIAVNQAWRSFADAHGLGLPEHGLGCNYLQICDRAAEGGVQTAEAVAMALREMLAGTRAQFHTDYHFATPVFEDERWFALDIRTFASAGRSRVLLAHHDISETRQLSRQLEYQARHDALTGLINRHEFERRLEALVDSARADGAEHVLCYLDLDQFKVVNDTCGHVAGDELLRQVSRTIARCVRHGDTLARLGGDEFGILMDYCPLDIGLQRAEAVRAALEESRFTWQEHVFSIGASIGITCLDQSVASAGAAMSHADAACYVAKDEGRNRVRVHDDGDERRATQHGQMRWVSRLQWALDLDRLELHYQPILPLGNGSPGSNEADVTRYYELLVRLVDEDGSLVSPGAFLPAAERFHLASRIDRWVVSRALGWLASQPAHLAALEMCSINLSGQSLGDEGFLEFVLERLERSGVPPSKLAFEVTETAAIANLNNATVFMEGLAGRGCRFALDDFGSGLSSFAYLKHLPVEILKIDGVFVRDLLTDPIDAALVRSINEIGHVMGLKTVAEFVESQQIIERLTEIGVDYVQGYAVGAPRPLSSLART
ncbi:MAG: EAL domain-containing protein [Gammaproteobacteria bacterium]|nr:EAL domain-containing protein [Gammaproteobacteria bacterium]